MKLIKNLFKEDNLRIDNLSEANLKGAKLLKVIHFLKGKLNKDSLKYTDLEGVNLEEANLEGFDLERANLEGASLRKTNLKGANLIGTYLVGANLIGANLEGADLRRANLRRANLEEVNFKGTIYENDIPLIINTEFYNIVKTKNLGIKIGCKTFTKKQLKEMTSKKAREIDGDKAVKFWIKYKKLLLS